MARAVAGVVEPRQCRQRSDGPVAIDTRRKGDLPGVVDCVAGRNAEIDELGLRSSAAFGREASDTPPDTSH
jgi:hypothetical protein